MLLEAIAVVAHPAPYGVVVTDAQLDGGGPHILYVNPAFELMTGFAAADVLGSSPRMLQGARTSALARLQLRHALQRGNGHRTTLVNYRCSGEAYKCVIEITPLRDASGVIQMFMAIEREEPVRRGRRRKQV